MVESSLKIDLELLEREQLVGRLKLIELLEQQSHYRDLPDRAERRFAQALSTLPSKWRETALAVFGSVSYVPKQILDDAWRYLWWNLCQRMGGPLRQSNMLVLELDRDALRDDFYRANSLVGRLQDNLPFRSTYDLVDGLMQLEAGHSTPELSELLPRILHRPLWVLLVDVSISGGSVAAEMERLRQIRDFCVDPESISVVALIQLCTDQAHATLQAADCDYTSAVRVPIGCALNGESYSLLSTQSLIKDVHSLCHWFANTHVLTSEYRLAKLSRERNDPELATYGFGKMGWNIVTYRNTPNNSLPILWFRPPTDDYLAPFERIDSRIGPSWPGRRDWLSEIRDDDARKGKLRFKLARA